MEIVKILAMLAIILYGAAFLAAGIVSIPKYKNTVSSIMFKWWVWIPGAVIMFFCIICTVLFLMGLNSVLANSGKSKYEPVQEQLYKIKK